MKNKRKTIIIISSIIVLLVAIGTVFYIFQDENRLTINEKEWINNNKQSVIKASVVNNLNNFGSDGEGVFFDYLNDFAKEYDLTVNTIPFSYGATPEGISFNAKQTITEKDYVLFRDHYVMVSRDSQMLADPTKVSTAKIAVLSFDLNYIKSYLPEYTFEAYDSASVVMTNLETNTDISYALVPQNMFINSILSNGFHVVYHFSDIPMYYTMSFSSENELSSIMRKFCNNWILDKFPTYYNEKNVDLFVKSLNITEKDKDILTNKIYNYGLVESTPYEVLMSNNYGGIASVYLKKFSEFSGVEFKNINYKDQKALADAVKNKRVDLFFDYYGIEDTYENIPLLESATVAIVTLRSNNTVVNRLESLKNKTIYVEKGSRIQNYLTSLGYLNIKTYEDEDELMDIKDDDIIIAMEESAYLAKSKDEFKNHFMKYSVNTNFQYSFNLNGDATFYKLFSNFLMTMDTREMMYDGINSYVETESSGSFLSTVATYALCVFAFGGVIVFVAWKSKKKIHISKKIRKEDKLRFIDQLTSLKNRNYLSENVDGWNKNTIYPQGAVVVDLNNIKYINDTFGTNEGDKQIKAAANILMKTQIDNTDIIRTDGNEFLVYMIGFEEKRVISYMRKLYKEFNNLPYDYGAAIGYSMRTDDLKTIDDVINEATLDMRTKKEAKEKEL